jgi:hypothetical protein
VINEQTIQNLNDRLDRYSQEMKNDVDLVFSRVNDLLGQLERKLAALKLGY